MEIYRANFYKWVWDDAYGRGHSESKEIGFYLTRENAERQLYLYIAQRNRGVDKEKLKKQISLSNKEDKVVINGNDYWIDKIVVQE